MSFPGSVYTVHNSSFWSFIVFDHHSSERKYKHRLYVLFYDTENLSTEYLVEPFCISTFTYVILRLMWHFVDTGGWTVIHPTNSCFVRLSYSYQACMNVSSVIIAIFILFSVLWLMHSRHILITDEWRKDGSIGMIFILTETLGHWIEEKMES
jgi:formate-dependent nitrite reductase membrane component NrfD